MKVSVARNATLLMSVALLVLSGCFKVTRADTSLMADGKERDGDPPRKLQICDNSFCNLRYSYCTSPCPYISDSNCMRKCFCEFCDCVGNFCRDAYLCDSCPRLVFTNTPMESQPVNPPPVRQPTRRPTQSPICFRETTPIESVYFKPRKAVNNSTCAAFDTRLRDCSNDIAEGFLCVLNSEGCANDRPFRCAELSSYIFYPNACFSTPNKKVANGRYLQLIARRTLVSWELTVGDATLTKPGTLEGWDVSTSRLMGVSRFTINCNLNSGCHYPQLKIIYKPNPFTGGRCLYSGRAITVRNGFNGTMWITGGPCSTVETPGRECRLEDKDCEVYPLSTVTLEPLIGYASSNWAQNDKAIPAFTDYRFTPACTYRRPLNYYQGD